jgi:hypothetical protein
MSESDAGIETQGDPDDLSLSCMYVMWEGIGVQYIDELRLNYSLAKARPQLSFVGIAYGG